MVVRLHPAARAELLEIADFIAHDNPLRAASFIAELRLKCLGLAEMPQAWPLVPGYEQLGLRRRIYGNYLIFYRISGDPARIDVLHVVHGARDYSSILSGSEPYNGSPGA